MKSALFESDYAPGTFLRVVQTDDGDIILKTRGDGEMRIATSGGKLHGVPLAVCVQGFNVVIAALALHEADEKAESCCKHCLSESCRGCGDCDSPSYYKREQAKAKDDFETAIKSLRETAQSKMQAVQGKWIPRNPDCRGYADTFGCTECQGDTQVPYAMKQCDYAFCPHCGVAMKLEDDLLE